MKLILLPEELREYIILHELVHLKVKTTARNSGMSLHVYAPISRNGEGN